MLEKNPSLMPFKKVILTRLKDYIKFQGCVTFKE